MVELRFKTPTLVAEGIRIDGLATEDAFRFLFTDDALEFLAGARLAPTERLPMFRRFRLVLFEIAEQLADDVGADATFRVDAQTLRELGVRPEARRPGGPARAGSVASTGGP